MNLKEAVSHKSLGISDDMVISWKKKGFSLHYIPTLELADNEDFSISQKNVNILKGTKPLSKSHFCSEKWILIETADLKRARVPWISSADTSFLKWFGVDVKKRLQKHTRVSLHDDNLVELLSKHGQYSRFCMDITEVKTILDEVSAFLTLPDTAQVRLPHYVEYCYLCKNFYPEWTNSKTWEWLEDIKEDGQYLATGYEAWNKIGYDPANYWSTILGFRVIVEL